MANQGEAHISRPQAKKKISINGKMEGLAAISTCNTLALGSSTRRTAFGLRARTTLWGGGVTYEVLTTPPGAGLGPRDCG